ncbi:MAG: adenylate/guanylate cyclase domain-containing protein [Methylacidiphilales bacterium]|nr:adenylate/guanylate cyclase domain-containing protein [Candidatus Methylacidiphilales bacterium]
MTTQTNKVILFADITGSTKLYDTYGNQIAESIISISLSKVKDIIKKYNGTVIKTIGDEVMCSFESGNEALDSAAAIHLTFNDHKVLDKYTISFKIGADYGEVIMSDNDLFGNAVNIASRMTSIARSSQTIYSESLYNYCDEDHKNNSRKYDITNVRGKEAKLTIYEHMWETEENTELTRIASHNSSTFSTEEHQYLSEEIALTYMGEKFIYQSTLTEAIMLGRAIDNTLAVSSTFASRYHAKIEYRRNKFIINDQSTNGTTIIIEKNNPLYIKREGLPLINNGKIIFGLYKDGEFISENMIEFTINKKV